MLEARSLLDDSTVTVNKRAFPEFSLVAESFGIIKLPLAVENAFFEVPFVPLESSKPDSFSWA